MQARAWQGAGSCPDVVQTANGSALSFGGFGGDEETRTPDFLLAKEALYQLSYVPLVCSATYDAVRPPVASRWAFLDSNQRPLPYQGSALTS